MRRHKTLIFILLILLAGLIWWWYSRGEGEGASAGGQDASLIYDRLWVDQKPKMAKEYIQALVVVEHLPVGIFQKASAYRAELERFDYRLRKDVLDLRLPQTDREAKVRFSISACKDLPPYDLCLVLDRHPLDGPRRFYGLRNPKRGSDAHRALHERLLRTLSRK